MRERECESEGEGNDDEVELKRKRQSFGVESKIFEVEVEKRRGKTLFFIVEVKEEYPHGLDWGRQALGSFWKGWTSALRMGKTTNGRRAGRKRGEGTP